MAVILVVLMFALFIGIGLIRQYRSARAPELTGLSPASSSNVFTHPSHTFARVVNDGRVEVGLDDFARKAFGSYKLEQLPELGAELEQGEVAWKTVVGGRKVTQRMPVHGRITAINNEEPSSERSWILRVKPSNLQDDLANLIRSASSALWLRRARSRFVQRYSGGLVAAMHDGGEFVDGFAAHLDETSWREFCREFFNSEGCE